MSENAWFIRERQTDGKDIYPTVELVDGWLMLVIVDIILFTYDNVEMSLRSC